MKPGNLSNRCQYQQPRGSIAQELDDERKRISPLSALPSWKGVFLLGRFVRVFFERELDRRATGANILYGGMQHGKC